VPAAAEPPPVKSVPVQPLEKTASRIESPVEEAVARGMRNAAEKPAKSKNGLIIGGIIAAVVASGAFIAFNKKSEKKRPPAQAALLQQMLQNQGQSIA
jgi:hypothetical protein